MVVVVKYKLVLGTGVEQSLLGRHLMVVVVAGGVSARAAATRSAARSADARIDRNDASCERGRIGGGINAAARHTASTHSRRGAALRLLRLKRLAAAVRRRRILRTPATVSRVARIAVGAQRHTATHRPVAPQARQHERQGAQPRPALRPLVRNARARIVRTGQIVAVAVRRRLVIFGTVIEERLDAAQTRRVVDDGLGAAEARLVADPTGRQLARSLALDAAAPLAMRTCDRVDGVAVVARRLVRVVEVVVVLGIVVAARLDVLAKRYGLFGDDAGLVERQQRRSSGPLEGAGRCCDGVWDCGKRCDLVVVVVLVEQQQRRRGR